MNKEVCYENNCIICGEQGIFGVCYSCIQTRIKEKEEIKLLKEKRKEQKHLRKEMYQKEIKKIKEKERKWVEEVKENNKIITEINKKEYYKKNCERIKSYMAKFRKTAKGKIITSKSNNKRKRNLGFVPLNSRFEGSEAHHIDLSRIVYIPKDIHRSVYHNINTNEGINEINTKVFEWLKFQ